MKKIALLLALLMVMSSVPAFASSISATVDGYLDRRAESDIHPVRDSARLLRGVNDGVNHTRDAMDPVLRHHKHVTDPVMDGAKFIVNGTYDFITKPFDRFREDK